MQKKAEAALEDLPALSENAAFVKYVIIIIITIIDRAARWRNVFQPDLLGILEDEQNDVTTRGLARRHVQLWESHTALMQLLGKKDDLTTQEVHQLEHHQQRCRVALGALRQELMPWMHVLYCHSAQLVRLWGSLSAFGTWGLEGRHRTVKQWYDHSIRATRRKRQEGTGAGDILARTTVRTILTRLRHVKKLKQRRLPQHARRSWLRVQARACRVLRI